MVSSESTDAAAIVFLCTGHINTYIHVHELWHSVYCNTCPIYNLRQQQEVRAGLRSTPPCEKHVTRALKIVVNRPPPRESGYCSKHK